MSDDLRPEPSDYFVESNENLQADIARARELGDRQAESLTLGHLGGLYCFHWTGPIRRAVDYYQQALAIAREIGDKDLEADHLDGLGTCYGFTWDHKQHDFPLAIRYFEESLAIARETGNRKQEGSCLEHLGSLWKYQNDYPRALSLLEEAAAIARERHDTDHEGRCLQYTGTVYRAMEDWSQAVVYLEQAASVYLAHEAENGWHLAYTLGYLAETYHQMGDQDKAAECLRQGRLAVQRIDESFAEAFESRFGKLEAKIADARAKLDSSSPSE